MKKHEEAFVQFLHRRTQGEKLPATQPCPGPSVRCEAQKQSVACRVSPHQDWGLARSPHMARSQDYYFKIEENLMVLRPAL